jgi:hypothetical protein
MAADHLKEIDQPVTFLPKNQFEIDYASLIPSFSGIRSAVTPSW